MENGEKNIPFYNRLSFIIPMILLGLFMVCHLVLSLKAPAVKLREIQAKYGFVQNKKNPVDERILSDSLYLALMKEKAFYQSRVAMAASDSIYMTINLADSTVNLEISGVTVHTAIIKRKKVSRILKRNEYSVLNMFSVPFVIAMDYSSIKKEPLMIKMAPKDTSEYQPDIIPDTADYEPVNFILVTENGVNIHLYQEEKIRPGDNFKKLLFDLRHRLRVIASSAARTATLKIPDYNPYIKIVLPRADAKRIYRALPYHGQAGVYL